MACVDWSENYELGISQLDEHHRRLVGILNSTYDCCLDESREDSLESIVEELANYAGYHFSAEERIMQDNDYPELQAHRKEHDLFTRQVAQFRQDLRDGKGLLAMEMMKFLGAWLIDHILVVDRKLSTYLAAKGVSLPA